MSIADLLKFITESNNDAIKKNALLRYFKSCNQSDLWTCVKFLSKNPIRKIITNEALFDIAKNKIQYEEWLIERSIDQCNDIHDAMELLLPISNNNESLNITNLIEEIKVLSHDQEDIKNYILSKWNILKSGTDRYFFNKIITGNIRIRIEASLIYQALSEYCNKPIQELALLFYSFNNSPDFLITDIWPDPMIQQNLLYKSTKKIDKIKIHELQIPHQKSNILAKVISHGLKIQIIKQNTELIIWNIHTLTIIKLAPNIQNALEKIQTNFILNASYAELKKYIADQKENYLSIDTILEVDDKPYHDSTLSEQESIIKNLMQFIAVEDNIVYNELMQFKNKKSITDYFKKIDTKLYDGLICEIEPNRRYEITFEIKEINAVLLYAQKIDASLSAFYDQYTLAVRLDDRLIPITKINATLDEDELIEVHQYILENTIERFGPVRSIHPLLIISIGYSRIELSKRNKSGITLQDARLIRLERDMNLNHVTLLSDIKKEINEN